MKFQFFLKGKKLKFSSWQKNFPKCFVYFLYNLHPLFHLKVSKISFSNSYLFPHADDSLLQETPCKLAENRSGVSIEGHVPASQGSSRRYLSHGGGARRREGPRPCLVPLTEYCDSPCNISIFLFGSTPIIYSFLFVIILFHPHSFNFFYSNTKF